MHPFAEQLISLINNRNVKKMALCRYLNMDRSTLYQILNGKRFPSSPDILDSLAAYLSLSSEEYKALQEAWKFEKIGSLVYYRRKQIRDFLESCIVNASFTKPDKIHFSAKGSDFIKESPSESFRLLSGQDVILETLHQILTMETRFPEGNLACIFQPNQAPVLELIQDLLAAHPFRMDHIICLNKTDTLNSHQQMLNFALVSPILPLYENPATTYHTFYHYNAIPDQFTSFAGMSCLFLTASCALACTLDLQTGILFTNKDCVRLYWNLFRKCREISSQLLQIFPVDYDNRFLMKFEGDVYIPVNSAFSQLPKFYICINEQKMIIVCNKIGISIEEISILSAFRDFLSSEENSNFEAKRLDDFRESLHESVKQLK